MKLRLNENYNQSDSKIALLCALLNCGYGDFQIIEDCKYNFYDIIDECKNTFGCELTSINDSNGINFNNLVRSVFYLGIYDLQSAIENRMDEIDDQEEYDALYTLDVYRDIKMYANCTDSHIYFDEDVEDIYRTYLSDVIDEIEDKMGFEFGV